MLGLPAPPPRLYVHARGLAKALAAAGAHAEVELVMPGEGNGKPRLEWHAGDVVQGRALLAWGVFDPVPRRIPIEPARLALIARKVAAEEIHITFEREVLVASAVDPRTGISARFRLLSPARRRAMPAVPEPPAARWLVKPEALAATLSQVAPFAQKWAAFNKATEQYPAIAGVRLECEPGGVRLVATDGHRLVAQSLATADDDGETFASFTIPPSALRALAEFLKTPGRGHVALAIAPGQGEDAGWLRVEDAWGHGESIACLGLGGKFPRWEKCVPDHDALGSRLRFRREDLARALQTFIKLAGKDQDDGYFTGVVFRQLRPDYANLRARPDHGDDDARETDLDVPCHLARNGEGGRAVLFHVNPRYLADLLGRLDRNVREVELEFSGTMAPLVVRGQAGLVAVVMPINPPDWAREKETRTAAATRQDPPRPARRQAKPKAEPRPKVAKADGPAAEREPCLDCGTTGGGRTSTGAIERSKGRCMKCYNAFRRKKVCV